MHAHLGQPFLIYQVVIDLMLEKYVLFGYSGHSFVLLDSFVSMGKNVYGYFEKERKIENPYELNYLGTEQEFEFKYNTIALLGIGNNLVRQRIANWVLNKNVKLGTVVDATAVFSSKATLGNGSFIGPRAIVNSMTNIGIGSIVNSGAIVEHECSRGAFSHIAPGAVLCGNVRVGEKTLIGANATVLPGISIGKNCIIGAGAVIVKNLEDNSVVKGNPGKKTRDKYA